MQTTNETLELPFSDCYALSPQRLRRDRAPARYVESKLRKPGEALNSPALAKNLFVLRLADKRHEVFEVAFLDAQNWLIAVETLSTAR